MGQYYDTLLGLDTMSAEEIDQVAILEGGLVGGIGYGYKTRGQIPELPGGWDARWVGTKGLGNYGDLVLVATDSRTRALLREGKIRLYMREGQLSRDEAERLHRARARYKMELIGLLGWIIDHPRRRAAMLAHPGSYGPGSGRAAWLARWGRPAFGDDLDLSAPREAELAKIVRAMA